MIEVKQMSIKISIILPVYNVEQYLKECLDSILHQTLKEIEVICVDDGSTDTSLSILNHYVKKDKRIKTISQGNKGVSVARNQGLLVAKGEYIYFMDSDDYLNSSHSLEQIYNVMSNENLDVVSFNYKTIGFEEKSYKLAVRAGVVMDGKQYLRENGRGNVMPWLRCMRREYLDRIGFEFLPNINGEDDEAMPRICYDAKRIKHIEDILMAYRQRENSITKSTISMLRIYGLGACAKTYFNLSKREDEPSFSKQLYKYGLEYLFICYKSVYDVEETNKAKQEYKNLLQSCSFSSLEIRLLQNEEKYIDQVEIQHKSKWLTPFIYYLHKLRQLYFNKIRIYGKVKK